MDASRIIFHQDAIGDVRNAVAWYQERSPKAALDFIEELRRATDTIREAPRRWPVGKNKTRKFLLWQFPFAVVYSEQPSEIIVWAVAHGSRLPEYWKDRLP